MIAGWERAAPVVTALLDAGAVDVARPDGNRAIDDTVEYGNDEIIALLQAAARKPAAANELGAKNKKPTEKKPAKKKPAKKKPDTRRK